MKRSAPATTIFTAFGLAAVGGVPAVMSSGAVLTAPQAAHAAANACSALAAPGLFDHTTVKSATMVAADAAKSLPAFCEVTAVVSPAAGSTIGVVYRLPDDWNGKVVGLGGGGWAGNTQLGGFSNATPSLQRGYATFQTDGGHSSTSVWDTSWASNPEAITDFAYRAVHLMTVIGKDVTARYYGKPQSEAYWWGCSTGGRQGMMETQRFPADYNGVVAGAPVYNLLVQLSAVIRDQTFSAPGAGFTADQLNMVNKAVLDACDAKDGVKDGVITDPAACTWDPAELQCKPGQTGAQCLSEGQVNALRTAYAGVREIDGRVAAWPMERGGEAGWSRFVQTSGETKDATNGGGFGGLRGPLLGDPNFDMSKFDHAKELGVVRSSDFARQYEANDPAISAFTGRGGKLLLWHGWSDPGPSPIGTITYYEQVQGSVPNADQSVRLFLAPGVYHCGGGPGPDQMDLLGAIDRWVTTGVAPSSLIASKAGSKLSRPLCAYPATAHYKGSGDPDDASSFECK